MQGKNNNKIHIISRKLYVLLLGAALILQSSPALAQAANPEQLQSTANTIHMVRIKDVGGIVESRDNQLIGFGLVVGLRNTGDSRSTIFTQKALTNMLKKMGVPGDKKHYKSRNVASVMVTATLPPYIKRGQRISVIVSSLGDANSLSGGTLVMTPLQGADFKTYAVAQGPVIVGGVSAESTKGSYRRNQTTVGRVPNGAIVEMEVPITALDQDNITIVLNSPNFITASRTAKALNEQGFEGAKAIDASTIKVPITEVAELSYVEVIAKIENVELAPDASSKIVINSRTGTVVIGEKVRLMPVAVTHGGMSIKIEGSNIESARIVIADASTGKTIDQTGVDIQEEKGQLQLLQPSATLSSLVDALNEMGVSSKDMIAILQALKESGALIATIEII